MADPVTKIIGRYFRRIFIWPIEAGFISAVFCRPSLAGRNRQCCFRLFFRICWPVNPMAKAGHGAISHLRFRALIIGTNRHFEENVE